MVEVASWLAVTDAAYRAFDEAIQADAPELEARFERLFIDDPGEFRRVLSGASRCGDIKTVEILGGILERHDGHDRASLTAYAAALLHRESYAAAFALLERLRGGRSVSVRYGRARALAGMGDLDQALAAVEDALLLRPEHGRSQALREQLLVMLPLQAQGNDLRSWPELRTLLQGYLALGLKASAADLLRRVMRRDGSTELSIGQHLQAAGFALRVCPPQEVRAYLAQIPRKYEEAFRALEIACDALSGETPQCEPEPAPHADKGLRIWTALACEAAGDLPGAIRRFSSLAEEYKRDPDIRGSLARVVGRAGLQRARPRFAPGRSGKIINLIVFNNELALLRMHLEEMASFVDRFVIVEAAQTFMGADKPLHFERSRELFAEFADRIVHVTVPHFPDHAVTAWARDFHQRDVAVAAAQDLCGQDDYILATDTDEIIAPGALDGFMGDFACLQLSVSRYFLNYRMKPGHPKATRPASLIVKAKHLQEHGLSYVRFFLARRWSSAYAIPDAGWHFTSVSHPDRIAQKLGSYAHQEQRKAEFKTPAFLAQVIERIRGGEFEPDWERVELDDRLPGYVQRNQSALGEMIL